MTDITHYLDFVLTLFFAFGLAFEVPIATIVLVIAGATTPEKLATKRPYVIVGAFVIGMFLTPPDIISQTLLALPMWVLFEVGLLFSRLVVRDRARRQQEDDGESTALATTAAAGQGKAATETAQPEEEGEFRPMDEQEMEDEFDRIEQEFEELEARSDREEIGEEAGEPHAEPDGWSSEDSADMLDEEEEFPARTATEALVDAKLEQVAALRSTGAYDEARRLLYEVLSEGNETQVRVARNILEQLDD